MKDSLFIVSTGRTGTHFLANFFDEHVPSASGYHEPKPAFKRRGYELVNRPPTLYERIYFTSFRKIRFLWEDTKYYVEANNCLFSAIPLIRDCFDSPTVIHVIRDGREVVRSYMNSFKRYAKNPYGGSQLNPDHFGKDPYSSKWSTMSPIQKMSWFWLRVNETIEDANPDLTIYFEDLFSPPHSGMRDILDQLNGTEISEKTLLEAFSNKEHSASIPYVPDWSGWPDLWKEQFIRICGSKMEEYGYEIEK